MVALVVVAACGPGRAAFDRHSLGELKHAFARGGLEVCSTLAHADGLANQAVSSEVMLVGIDCHEQAVSLIVDRFANPDDRDSAARNFEVLVRPRGDGVVWTWGRFTIFAVAGRDAAVMRRITKTLDRIGAA